ncbi:MAG: hypothetical protein ACFB0B_11385 [Thermonemataceae bacterium]
MSSHTLATSISSSVGILYQAATLSTTLAICTFLTLYMSSPTLFSSKTISDKDTTITQGYTSKQSNRLPYFDSLIAKYLPSSIPTTTEDTSTQLPSNTPKIYIDDSTEKKDAYSITSKIRLPEASEMMVKPNVLEKTQDTLSQKNLISDKKNTLLSSSPFYEEPSLEEDTKGYNHQVFVDSLSEENDLLKKTALQHPSVITTDNLLPSFPIHFTPYALIPLSEASPYVVLDSLQHDSDAFAKIFQPALWGFDFFAAPTAYRAEYQLDDPLAEGGEQLAVLSSWGSTIGVRVDKITGKRVSLSGSAEVGHFRTEYNSEQTTVIQIDSAQFNSITLNYNNQLRVMQISLTMGGAYHLLQGTHQVKVYGGLGYHLSHWREQEQITEAITSESSHHSHFSGSFALEVSRQLLPHIRLYAVPYYRRSFYTFSPELAALRELGLRVGVGINYF